MGYVDYLFSVTDEKYKDRVGLFDAPLSWLMEASFIGMQELHKLSIGFEDMFKWSLLQLSDLFDLM